MSARQSRIAWGVVLGLCGLVGIGLSMGQAQQANRPAVETLLPANSIVYVGWDGEDAHKQSWEKTAAYEALYKSGLMGTLQKIVGSVVAQVDSGELQILRQGCQQIAAKGLSLSVALPPADAQQPPLPRITLVLHDSANLQPGLAGMVKKAAEDEFQFAERQVQGRQVTSAVIPGSPGVEIGWWTEGTHLMIVAGINAVDSAVAVAAGKSPNITTDRNWNKYRTGPRDFDMSLVGWLNLGALRERFGAVPLPIPDPNAPKLTVNQVLAPFGLDTLGTLVCQSGYKGRALWSETTLEAPSPRRGLLAYADQIPITLADLPPLPAGTNGFYACSFDWSKFYDDTITMVKGVAALAPEEAAVQVEGVIQNLPRLAGFDPKKELLDALGGVSCVYGDPSQGVFGLGVGFACKVDDAQTLRKTLIDLARRAAEQAAADELQIRITQKHGRDIVTFEIAGGVFNPSFAVDKDWLVIGLFPQTVEAFLLRVDGKLPSWRPTPEYREALAQMPGRFTSIAASDPRQTVKLLMGLAPMLLSVAKAGLQEIDIPGAGRLELQFSAADFPPAEVVARPLFPNLTISTVDEQGFHSTSRTSLPSIPLAGGPAAVTTTAVLTALLLPAVQQGRTAARRAQSKSRLKNLVLALHNFHETHGAFPRGTNLNKDLKPDKRLSWQASILPFLDEAALHERIDFDEAWDSDANKQFMKTKIQIFQNSGVTLEKKTEYATTHFVGIAGIGKDAATLKVTDKNAGVFGYNRRTSFRDILDGTSSTVMVAEASKGYGPWGAGGKATIRGFVKKPYINGPDGIGGPWPEGGHFAFCDGHVRFISKNIDPTVVENLARINDGNVIDDF